eukprot:EG_transcript_8667
MSDCLVHSGAPPLHFHAHQLASALEALKLSAMPSYGARPTHHLTTTATASRPLSNARAPSNEKVGLLRGPAQQKAAADVQSPDPTACNRARRLMFINNPYALDGPLVVSCDPSPPCPEGRAGAFPDGLGGRLPHHPHAASRRCLACEPPSRSPFPAGRLPPRPPPLPLALLGSDCFAASPPAVCYASDPNEGRPHPVIPISILTPGSSEPSSLNSPCSSVGRRDDSSKGTPEGTFRSPPETPSHGPLVPPLSSSARRSRTGKASRPQPTMTLPACFTSAASLSSLSARSAEAPQDLVGPDAADDGPPAAGDGGCPHPKPWKRLRAKRGFTFFACRECGAKWRIFQPGAWLGVAEPVS